MNILAFETSCDETSVALLKDDEVVQYTASQVETHKIIGGVVPEVAAREHVPVIVPLIKQVLKKANVTENDIDRIAVTSGPGLITSVMVGVEAARVLAHSWNIPVFPVNHIEGHIAANFLTYNDIEFPAVALIVSGGHTELLYVSEPGKYELIGATRDDAAGECFDKCAKILGLDYPGGPEISTRAKQGEEDKYEFPSPMIDSKDFDFSFSGLKTSVLYFHKDNPQAKLEDVCKAIEKAIVNVLVKKTKAAMKQYKAKSLLVGGGVAANEYLRDQLTNQIDNVYVPDLKYCTDNAAMIAAACKFHDQPADVFSFKADPNWELTPR